jgi:preprotein translocase subunit SecF
MRFPIRFLPDTPNISFVRARGLGFLFSIIAMFGTAYLLYDKGLNLGIDFSGGIVIEAAATAEIDIAKMRNILADSDAKSASLQHIGDGTQVLIRMSPQEGMQQAALVEDVKTMLDASYGAPLEYVRVDVVGPQVGDELIEGSIMAILFGMVAIMLFLWFRFEWQFGLGGIMALFHDAVLTLGFFALTQLEFNLTSVAAILTVVGYSINDSVVIYDRIRENIRKHKKTRLETLIDRSINQTLSRTMLTSGTLIIAVAALALYGGDVLFGFSVAMLFGAVIGTYSSIYVSATILTVFRPRAEAMQETATA